MSVIVSNAVCLNDCVSSLFLLLFSLRALILYSVMVHKDAVCVKRDVSPSKCFVQGFFSSYVA